jgi:hypothetical protein
VLEVIQVDDIIPVEVTDKLARQGAKVRQRDKIQIEIEHAAVRAAHPDEGRVIFVP